ncbi:hypothetical protein [Azospirillum argentinense]|uniref:discoidin domain-containing protein n=1 Tax=Azospirillum argentinense TaxID=2970906 RepID=UPI0032DEBA97
MGLSYATMHNIGQVGTTKPSLAPAAGTGSPQNGAAVDRLGYYTGIGSVQYSTAGGANGGTITAKLQHSVDGSSGWTDYGDPVVKTLTGTNPSGIIELPVNLAGANRYVRVVADADPTGGTPTSIVAGVIALFGKDRV